MWKDAYLESRVLSADPIELIHILYEHTLEMVQDARRYLASGNIPSRSNSVTRAIAALDELDGSLNRTEGGAIAANLAGLYQYMRLRLLTGNIQQQDEPLAEVESLLSTLAEAWSGIRTGTTADPVAAAAAPSFGSYVPEPAMEYAQGWSA